MWQCYVHSNLGYEMFAGFDLVDCRQHWLVMFTSSYQLVAPGSIERLGSMIESQFFDFFKSSNWIRRLVGAQLGHCPILQN